MVIAAAREVPLRIDLNADAGESFGAWSLGDDAALLPWVTSINVACGFHAGDPSVLERTVGAASRAGVAVGAHPGYADLRGFGRRALAVAPADLEADVLYQVAAAQGFCRAHGIRLRHVKAHGALYNAASRDEHLARAVARGVARLDRELVLVGLAGSVTWREAAHAEGLRFAGEAFADRGYAPDGSLLPRTHPQALVTEPELAAAQALRLALEGCVLTPEGALVPVQAETLCVHGDQPGALARARAVHRALTAAGVGLAALGT
jgi:UPF0271 protein